MALVETNSSDSCMIKLIIIICRTGPASLFDFFKFEFKTARLRIVFTRVVNEHVFQLKQNKIN